MFCEQCGNKLPENAMFCPKCGTPAPKDDENIKTQNGGTEEYVENVEEPSVEKKMVSDNFETQKKPKKRRKKSKVIIALCTAVAVVGVSVGGFALYKNYEKNERVQKYYDVVLSFYLVPKETKHDEKYNYDKLSDGEKLGIEKEFSKYGIKMKNHYTFYNSLSEYESGYDWGDKYVRKSLKSGVCSDAVLNLPEDTYNFMYVTSYAISEGKIYGELNLDKKHKYKIKGTVNDPTDVMLADLERNINYYEKEKDNILLDEYVSEEYNDYEIWEKSYDSALKAYEKGRKKWINTTENIAEGESGFLFFKIKDVKGNTLLVEDCYVWNTKGKTFDDYIYKEYEKNTKEADKK